MNKKFAKLGLLFFVSILVAMALILMTLAPKQNKMTKVFMFDVGQGDSFFIETKGGKQMLIDGAKMRLFWQSSQKRCLGGTKV